MLGNWLKTSLLMAAVIALFGVVGAAIGGAQGLLVALILGGAMNFCVSWFSDKMVLKTLVLKTYNAQEVDVVSAPQFDGVVREFAARPGSALRASWRWRTDLHRAR